MAGRLDPSRPAGIKLAGKNGLPAWRWIFIIVGILTIPTAIFGQFSS